MDHSNAEEPHTSMNDVAMETNVMFIDDDITFNYTQNAYSGGIFMHIYITLVIFDKKKYLMHREHGLLQTHYPLLSTVRLSVL